MYKPVENEPILIPYPSADEFSSAVDGLVTDGEISLDDAVMFLGRWGKFLMDAFMNGRPCLESDGNGGFKNADPVPYIEVVYDLTREYNSDGNVANN